MTYDTSGYVGLTGSGYVRYAHHMTTTWKTPTGGRGGNTLHTGACGTGKNGYPVEDVPAAITAGWKLCPKCERKS